MEGPRFRVLGPVGTSEGSPGSPSQLLLLSVLLAHRGQHVRSQMLMDVLWGDQPPRTARQTLRTYISRLRQLLGDRLVASGEGYRLEVARWMRIGSPVWSSRHASLRRQNRPPC